MLGWGAVREGARGEGSPDADPGEDPRSLGGRARAEGGSAEERRVQASPEARPRAFGPGRRGRGFSEGVVTGLGGGSGQGTGASSGERPQAPALL